MSQFSSQSSATELILSIPVDKLESFANAGIRTDRVLGISLTQDLRVKLAEVTLDKWITRVENFESVQVPKEVQDERREALQFAINELNGERFTSKVPRLVKAIENLARSHAAEAMEFWGILVTGASEQGCQIPASNGLLAILHNRLMSDPEFRFDLLTSDRLGPVVRAAVNISNSTVEDLCVAGDFAARGWHSEYSMEQFLEVADLALRQSPSAGWSHLAQYVGIACAQSHLDDVPYIGRKLAIACAKSSRAYNCDDDPDYKRYPLASLLQSLVENDHRLDKRDIEPDLRRHMVEALLTQKHGTLEAARTVAGWLDVDIVLAAEAVSCAALRSFQLLKVNEMKEHFNIQVRLDIAEELLMKWEEEASKALVQGDPVTAARCHMRQASLRHYLKFGGGLETVASIMNIEPGFEGEAALFYLDKKGILRGRYSGLQFASYRGWTDISVGTHDELSLRGLTSPVGVGGGVLIDFPKDDGAAIQVYTDLKSSVHPWVVECDLASAQSLWQRNVKVIVELLTRQFPDRDVQVDYSPEGPKRPRSYATICGT